MSRPSKARAARIRNQLIAAGWKLRIVSVLGIDQEFFVNPRTGKTSSILAAFNTEWNRRK